MANFDFGRFILVTAIIGVSIWLTAWAFETYTTMTSGGVTILTVALIVVLGFIALMTNARRGAAVADDPVVHDHDRDTVAARDIPVRAPDAATATTANDTTTRTPPPAV